MVRRVALVPGLAAYAWETMAGEAGVDIFTTDIMVPTDIVDGFQDYSHARDYAIGLALHLGGG